MQAIALSTASPFPRLWLVQLQYRIHCTIGYIIERVIQRVVQTAAFGSQ